MRKSLGPFENMLGGQDSTLHAFSNHRAAFTTKDPSSFIFTFSIVNLELVVGDDVSLLAPTR